MKKSAKKSLSVLLSLVMLISLVPAFPLAGAEEKTEDTGFVNGYIDTGYTAPVYKPVAVKGLPTLDSASPVPEKYDARSTGIVPPVRSQGAYGTCWAFSAIAAMEINLCKKGLADPDTIDLSELQLIYYQYNVPDDPLGNFTGDSVKKDDILNGGNSGTAAWTIARSGGAAEEEFMSYSDAPYALQIGYPASYASDYNRYRLDNYYELSFANNRNEIKAAITEFGCASASYYSDDGRNGGTGYYSEDEESYYQNIQTSTNHAVTIVGWDDTYKKENFREDMRPKNDGAWLVRNSWGDHHHGDGYFYISYEDTSIQGDARFFDCSASGEYDNIYQYDGGIYTSAFSNTGVVGMASLFTASEDETLKAVTTSYLYTANVSYTVEIYKNVTDNTFLNKEPESVQTGSTAYAGIYTVELSKPVSLSKGERFAVVVRSKLTDPSGGGTMFFDYDAGLDGGSIKYTSQYDPAESYRILKSGGLEDLSSSGRTPRIKALTALNTVPDAPTGIDASLNGNSVNIKWNSVTGASEYDVYTAVENGEWTKLGTVTGCSYTASVDNTNGILHKYRVKAVNGDKESPFSKIDTVRFPVTKAVTEIELSDLEICEYETGKAECKITPSDAEDKFVSFKSSDETVARINPDGTVTGVKAGNATITAVTRSGAKTATCTVTVIEHTEHTFTVTKTALEATCEEDGRTLEEACSVCGYVKTASTTIPKKGHDFTGAYVQNEGKTQHARYCKNGCGKLSEYVNCSGGTATCTGKAVCTFCENEYGAALGHDFTGAYVQNEGKTQHARYCKNGCGTLSEYVNCSGGKATCTEKAVCTFCENEYGAALGHDFTGAYVQNEGKTQHARLCKNGCGDTGTFENCYGGKATCTEKAQCDVCEKGYGSTLNHSYKTYSPDKAATCLSNATEKAYCEYNCGTFDEREVADTKLSHSYTGEAVSNNNGTHSFKCVNGCTTTGGTENCYGGKATCTEKAQCEKCGASYGKALGHDFGDDFRCTRCTAVDLDGARSVAKLELKSAAGDVSSKAMQRLISEAEKNINKAATLEAIESAKLSGIEAVLKEIAEPSPEEVICPKCGKVHGDSFIDKIVCFFNSIIYFFKNIFK